jgi:hypothetical protein
MEKRGRAPQVFILFYSLNKGVNPLRFLILFCSRTTQLVAFAVVVLQCTQACAAGALKVPGRQRLSSVPGGHEGAGVQATGTSFSDRR